MKNMKSIIAVLMCAAILLGVLWAVPGAAVNPVNAVGTETEELKASWRYTFEDATDLSSLTSNGWTALYGAAGVPKLFSIADLNGNTVLKYDNSSANPNALNTGSYGLASPFIKVTAGATVYGEVEMYTDGSTTTMLYLYFYDANGNKINEADKAGSKATNGAWNKITLSNVAPANATHARVMVYNGSSNTGIVYFDNVVIREQITTSSSNGFADGKNTSVWNSIDIDFESVHSIEGVKALGWNLTGAASSYKVVTEADGNQAMQMKANAYSPLLDVRGLTAIQASMELKTTTFVDLYAYFIDVNGATTLAEVSKRDEAASSLGVQDGDKWLPYTSKTIKLPEGTVYVMFMLYANSTTDALVDNFKVINAYMDHDELVYDFENGETMATLYADGWTPSNLITVTRAGTVVDAENSSNKVLKLQRTEKEGTIWLYSGYMNVEDFAKVTVSAKMMSTTGGLAQVYVYTYDANMTKTHLGLLQVENTQCDGQWRNLTKTLDLPEDAVYVNFMLCNGTKEPASYYDDISVTGVAATTPTTTAPATTAPATTAPATTAPATTAPATTAPATTAPATTAPATTAPATTAPATTAPATTAPATTAAADTTAAATTPNTGDTTTVTAMLVVMILAATTMIALVFGAKKRVF